MWTFMLMNAEGCESHIRASGAAANDSDFLQFCLPEFQLFLKFDKLRGVMSAIGLTAIPILLMEFSTRLCRFPRH